MDATPAQSSVRGIGLMLVGIGLFALSDALGKFLIGHFGVGQILAIRSAAGLCVLAPFLWREWNASGRVLPRPFLQLLRAVLATVEVILFYAAIRRLPLAETMTFYLASPIYVTALAAVCLGEPVGWRRWLAVLAGFGGVLVALSPSLAGMRAGIGTGAGQVIAVAGSICFALLLVLTRALRATPDSVLMAGQLVAALLYGVVTAPAGWSEIGTLSLTGLSMIGLLSMSGYLCVNRALRLAHASIVTPFQYTLIAWAMLFGYLFFGDVPKRETVAGAVIIVAAGIFIAAREHWLGRRARSISRPQAARETARSV